MPFLVYYQLRSKDQYLLSTLPFFFIYLTYNLLYSTGADITFFNTSTDLPLEKIFGLNNSRLKSILFTGLQATGLIVCTRMYLFGIVRNNYYRVFGDKLAIGISGFIPVYINDILKSFENLFGPRSISFLEVSDYKKSNNNNHLQASKSFLNPNSYNLSRLTKDLYLLADGKSIWQNINNSRRKIDSYDFIFVKSFKNLGNFFWRKIDNLIIDRFGPDGISNIIKKLSLYAVKFQSGFIYQYAFIMLLGFSILLTFLIIKSVSYTHLTLPTKRIV